MLQGYTMAVVPCGNPTPKKLPTGGGEWPTFHTACAQRAHSARYAPLQATVVVECGGLAIKAKKGLIGAFSFRREAPPCGSCNGPDWAGV